MCSCQAVFRQVLKVNIYVTGLALLTVQNAHVNEPFDSARTMLTSVTFLLNQVHLMI